MKGGAIAGTKTAAFTDIQGSTRWLADIGPERYTQVLGVHLDVIRGAAEENGGDVRRIDGDGTFLLFESATDALRGLVEAQLRIRDVTWPDGSPVAVRMGAHTGDITETPAGLVGLAIHQAARIMSAAHGGQILTSEETVTVTDTERLRACSVRELGAFRLKDLTAPQRLFQLCHPALPDRFPPPRTLDAHRHNLPVQPWPLVGRDEIVEAIAELIRSGRSVVTLTGAGGIGKTSIALQVAAEMLDSFAHGAWFVDLSQVDDAARVPAVVAKQIGARGRGGSAAAVTQWLSDRRALLVLDNLEQVLDAAPFVRSIAEHCPEVRLVVTSRAALGIRGEHLVEIPPLATPKSNDPDDIRSSDAVEVFRQRAQEHGRAPSLDGRTGAAVAELCRALEGVPLALELAAARLSALEPNELLRQVREGIDVLAAPAVGLAERHRTMRAAIDWTYRALPPQERRVFSALGVFSGGCTLDAARAVVGKDVTDVVAGLVSKSLLRRVEGKASARVKMLEPIRAFAVEKLDGRKDAAAIRERCRAWFATRIEDAAGRAHTTDEPESLDALEDDHENVMSTVLASASADRIALAVALRRYWTIRADPREVIAILEGSLTEAERTPVADAARALLASLLLQVGETDRALTIAEAISDGADPADRIRALLVRAIVAESRNDHTPCKALLNQAQELARTLRDDEIVAEVMIARVDATTVPEPKDVHAAAESARAAGDLHTEAVLRIWELGVRSMMRFKNPSTEELSGYIWTLRRYGDRRRLLRR